MRGGREECKSCGSTWRLGRSFFAWDDNTLKLQFEHFVWLISSLCNWDIDAGMHCLQFNYQHCPFAPHVDGTGILQPKLMGGDGFGDQIAVVNVRGDSWLFVASEVPNSFPTKYVGFKARIPEGGLWAIEGSTRYKAMHGVLSDSVPGVFTISHVTPAKSLFPCEMDMQIQCKHVSSRFLYACI